MSGYAVANGLSLEEARDELLGKGSEELAKIVADSTAAAIAAGLAAAEGAGTGLGKGDESLFEFLLDVMGVDTTTLYMIAAAIGALFLLVLLL